MVYVKSYQLRESDYHEIIHDFFNARDISIYSISEYNYNVMYFKFGKNLMNNDNCDIERNCKFEYKLPKHLELVKNFNRGIRRSKVSDYVMNKLVGEL